MHPEFLGDENQIAPPATVLVHQDDGSFVLRSPVALGAYARCIGEWVEQWARETPHALALAERDETAEHWRTLTYGELRQAVGAVDRRPATADDAAVEGQHLVGTPGQVAQHAGLAFFQDQRLLRREKEGEQHGEAERPGPAPALTMHATDARGGRALGTIGSTRRARQ